MLPEFYAKGILYFDKINSCGVLKLLKFCEVLIHLGNLVQCVIKNPVNYSTATSFESF